jgi:hypothetical protein
MKDATPILIKALIFTGIAAVIIAVIWVVVGSQ